MLSHESDVERAKRTKTCVNFRKQWEGEVHKTGKEKGEKKTAWANQRDTMSLWCSKHSWKKGEKKVFWGENSTLVNIGKKKKENKINLDLHEAKSEKKARSIAILCWRNNRDSKALLLSLTASPQKEKKKWNKNLFRKRKKRTHLRKKIINREPSKKKNSFFNKFMKLKGY